MTEIIYPWILAARPKTLTASIAPVLMGTTLAYYTGNIHVFITIVTFIAALAIQIGANYANDYFDFQKGVDSTSRIGPRRMTQSGMVQPIEMRNAFIISFSIAVILGIILLFRGGWPIFWIGIISIICAVLYTGGPLPFGSRGMGDIFVLIFFGPVAVGGTYYLQTLGINFTVILAGFAPGLISAAILAVNNLRDVRSDTETGKRTLAVIHGVDFVRMEYFYSITIACFIPFILVIINWSHWYILIISGIIYVLALPLFHKVNHGHIDKSLNFVLGATSFLLILYAVLFAFCW